MKKFRTKKFAAILAVIAVAAISAVGAFAYFTSAGTGTGSATVGVDQAVVLHGTTAAYPDGALYPGGPSQTVSFTVDNPSPGHQLVGTIHLVSVSTDGDHSGCEMSDFTMPDVVANQNVAGGNGIAITATGQLSMADNGNQNACKGAPLTLHLSSF